MQQINFEPSHPPTKCCPAIDCVASTIKVENNLLRTFLLVTHSHAGIIHTAGPQFADEPPMDEAPQSPVKDDPQTQFYKRHMSRTEAPHASGRTPIYDFDAWTEAHYGKTFARRQTAQNRYRNKQHDDTVEMNGRKSEILIFGMLSCFFGFFFVFLQWDKSSLDVPAATATDRKK